MRQTFGCVTCLARCTSRLNTHDRALVVGDVRQDGLERDPLAQFEILRLVELAHAAFRQVADDAEAEGDDVTGAKDGGPGRPSLCRRRAGGVVIVRVLPARQRNLPRPAGGAGAGS